MYFKTVLCGCKACNGATCGCDACHNAGCFYRKFDFCQQEVVAFKRK